MTKARTTRTQQGTGIFSDVGDFIKSHKLLSKAGKALTPFVSAWNPAAGVGLAGVSAGLDQAGWGHKNRGKHGAQQFRYNQSAVPVVSANYGRVQF